ncbi:MAG TPA: zf-HC2 domain-containing protein [Gemmatimonadaceae bacterium]|nr:zf-HC2 domain-containing protein [Gemmatimonadaceae bacterium]
MDCREFRNKHVAFVDDLLPAVEMHAMRQHVVACHRCSRRDTAIRRSLLLVRNLPTIEPSPDFRRRLNARLAELGPVTQLGMMAPQRSFGSIGAFVGLAAGIAAVAYMAIRTATYFAPMRSTAPATVATVRRVPAPIQPTTIAPVPNAAFVASVPTGIPVWPAMLMIGDAPLRFANAEFSETSLER